VLWAGGLRDAAAALGAPWQPTVGHHPDDPYGGHGVWRRIDAVRVTSRMLGALRGYHVTDTDEARRASDHLPVTTEYLPSAISAAPGRVPAGSAGQAS
jgi:endonuclease/exonuclease/phosphatase family metal-dependent hydrolase